jgi:hypothetical protein
MKFSTAMERVVKGHSVRREAWEDEKEHVELYENLLCVFRTQDRSYHSWLISREDMEATDWVLG